MIKEAYCSFEVAKLLKEKGFIKGIDLRLIPNLAFYDNIGLRYNVSKWYDSLIQDKIDFVVAPTHQMAMAWLREVHNIVISICNGNHKKDNGDRTTPDYSYFFFTITDSYAYYDENKQCTDEFNTYEEAVEAALKYTLENLI